MMKSVFASLFLFASVLTTASFAEARVIYWTGEAQSSYHVSRNPEWDCARQATEIADYGARQSCWQDFGYHRRVCHRAPVQRTENLGSWTDRHGNTYCTVRVYLDLP